MTFLWVFCQFRNLMGRSWHNAWLRLSPPQTVTVVLGRGFWEAKGPQIYTRPQGILYLRVSAVAYERQFPLASGSSKPSQRHTSLQPFAGQAWWEFTLSLLAPGLWAEMRGIRWLYDSQISWACGHKSRPCPSTSLPVWRPHPLLSFRGRGWSCSFLSCGLI